MFVRRIACLAFACSTSVLVAQDATPPARPKDDGRVRGITISTHGSGRDWGSDAIVPTLREVRDTAGAGWVAIHPYAWIRNDGEVRFRDFDLADPPAELVRPIREAHALGLRILIKPHIGYWGSKFSWRGEIDFAEPAERARFFADYRRWIVKVAAACHDADGFAVGTELDKLLDPERWREIVQEVRTVSDAKLTYAANWTDYQRVEFWDALDIIGVQAYFPLATAPTDDEPALRAGWSRRMTELRALAERLDRHVVFTELGYNRSFRAAVEPWAYAMDGQAAEATQLACMRVALEAIEAEPRVVGAFLWKWFPGTPTREHDFQVQNPNVLRVVRGVWAP